MLPQQGCSPQPPTLLPRASANPDSGASLWEGTARHQQGHSLGTRVRVPADAQGPGGRRSARSNSFELQEPHGPAAPGAGAAGRWTRVSASSLAPGWGPGSPHVPRPLERGARQAPEQAGPVSRILKGSVETHGGMA